MATIQTYDRVGIREDLEDVIYDVSPDEVPFTSAIRAGGGVKAKQTYHEWQTDSLRASAVNALVEGADASSASRGATARRGNYTQILGETVAVSGTDQAVDNAGRGQELAYQLVKAGKELKLDIEKAFMGYQARDAGNASTARKLAGLGSWIATNQSAGVGATVPTGDGTDARVAGTLRTFTQTLFDAQMQAAWEEGGQPSIAFMSAANMQKALDFTGNNNQRTTVVASEMEVTNAFDIYVTNFGSIRFVPSRECPANAVYLIDPEYWKVATLRPMKQHTIAKTGDAETRQLLTELTLVSANEKASAGVFDVQDT